MTHQMKCSLFQHIPISQLPLYINSHGPGRVGRMRPYSLYATIFACAHIRHLRLYAAIADMVTICSLFIICGHFCNTHRAAVLQICGCICSVRRIVWAYFPESTAWARVCRSTLRSTPQLPEQARVCPEPYSLGIVVTCGRPADP